jgi:hypothetical protein
MQSPYIKFLLQDFHPLYYTHSMSITALTSRSSVTKTLSKKVRAIIDHVITVAMPLEIYMIGSMMEGSIHRYSDLDLVVVIKGSFKRQDLSLKILPTRPHMDVPLDLHLVSQKEFLEFKDLGGICFEGNHHGKLIYRHEVS